MNNAIEFIKLAWNMFLADDYTPNIASWSNDAIINIEITLGFIIVALLIDCYFSNYDE